MKIFNPKIPRYLPFILLHLYGFLMYHKNILLFHFAKGHKFRNFAYLEDMWSFIFSSNFHVFFSLWNDCMGSFCFWKYVIIFSLSLMVSERDLSYRGKQKLNSKIWTFLFFIQCQCNFFGKNIKISSLWVTDGPLKELAILFQNRV